MSQAWSEGLLAKARVIRAAVFDVDGVMTDGRLYYSEDGSESKAFHTRDGLGLKGLINQGFGVGVITARQSGIVARRMQELGIEHFIQGCRDKQAGLKEMASRLALAPDELAYMGDDLVDWPALRQAGLKCAPADANDWIRDRVDVVTTANGGRGAVREICELILAAHGRLDIWRGQFQ